MKLTNFLTDAAVLQELGRRLARHRLDKNVSQAKLAREAGVARRTVQRLEGGESVQLTSFLRVLRVLGLAANAELLVPEPTVSPMEMLRLQQQRRQRAGSSKAPSPDEPSSWTWGDESS
jgi:transcriptional regulator with XRE-family HTH domain